MDQTDKKILSLLEENGRMPMKELAEKVSLTAPAARERVKKLEDKGIIEGYQAKISLSKLNKSITAFILFETDKCKDLFQFCCNYPEVIECHRLAGQYSYLVKICTFSMQTLEMFIDQAMQYGKSSTHLVLSSADKRMME